MTDPIIKTRVPILFLFLALLLAAAPLSRAADPGLQPGDTAPSFKLKDQDGKEQTLKSVAGPNGLLVLFSRSADWCGLCKSQLIDLEASREVLRKKEFVLLLLRMTLQRS